MAPSSDERLKDAPDSAKDAVLLESAAVPEGARQVTGIDFDKLDGPDLRVCDLVDAMGGIGFQASSVAEAVTTINRMVCPERFKSLIPLY